MKTEEAKRIAMGLRTDFKCESDTMVDFCNTIIKALEQEPCEDCISRAEVMDNYNGVETPVGYRKVVDMEVIKNMRSVYPKAKVGHWITKDGKEQGYDIAGVKTWYIQIVCSECGFIKTAIEGHTGQYHYCPNCGTEMQGVEEYGTRI